MHTLTPAQQSQAEDIAKRAINFLESRDHELATAIVRYQWANGDAADVVAALAAHQNSDGGFGNRLEPDIHAPESNPFAARIAMQVMRLVPQEASAGLRAQLGNWLGANQHDDGDWHFSDATKAGEMQPWFAAWEFPALNPACCVLGLASVNGIASKRMRSLVAELWSGKATIDQARTGSFYELLPYVEYSLAVQLPVDYLDAIAGNITSVGDDYEDAGHFFDMAYGGSEAITSRIPGDLVARWTDRLLQEPLDDGGWPSAYSDAWRPWTTATNLATLARLRG